jgi:hypothetical protein
MAYNTEIMTEIKNLSSFILSTSNMEYGDMIFFNFCFLFLQIFPRKVWYFQLKYMLNVLTKQYKSIKCSSIVNCVVKTW